jgi:hypothetical protein
MKKCWDKDPLKRPSSEEVLNIIRGWIFLPFEMEVKDISEKLRHNIMEFINAPIGRKLNTMSHSQASYTIGRKLNTKSNSQASYTSSFHNFTSENINDIINSDNCSDCIISN